MKLFTKKLLIPAAIAASIAVSVPAFVSGDFDVAGLNAQVQNHEVRITNLENATPAPTPTPQVIIETTGPGTTSAQSPQTVPVTAGSATGSAEAPAPSDIPTATPTPTPQYSCPNNPPVGTTCDGNNVLVSATPPAGGEQ